MAYTIPEVASDVRYYLGGLSCDLVDDTLLTVIISKNIDDITLPDDQKCKTVYDSVLATLRYLINKLVTDSGLSATKTIESSSGSEVPAGAVTSRREKIGKREVEIKYSDGSSSSSTSSSAATTTVPVLKDMYEEMLEDYLKNPQRICEGLVGGGDTGDIESVGSVVIGRTKDKSPWDRSTPWTATPWGDIQKRRW